MGIKYRICELKNGNFIIQTKGLVSTFFWKEYNPGFNIFELDEARKVIENHIKQYQANLEYYRSMQIKKIVEIIE